MNVDVNMKLKGPHTSLYSSFATLFVKVCFCTTEHEIQYNTKMSVSERIQRKKERHCASNSRVPYGLIALFSDGILIKGNARAKERLECRDEEAEKSKRERSEER